MMTAISSGNSSAGSDGSVKDAIGGHSFCITDKAFLTKIWGHARTIGIKKEMTSLRTEHGGAIAILLLLQALHIHFPHLPLPPSLDIWIDNSEVVRRGQKHLPKLGIKQQLVLDYDMWATTHRLLQALSCKIQWKWVKGHQQQQQKAPWKLEIDLNNFCDKKAESARALEPGPDPDPFLPDQSCGIICQGKRLHGSPREAITFASHGQQLQDYICEKAKWSTQIFQTVDWEGFYSYLKSLDAIRKTNVIKLSHNWVNDGHQKDLFSQGIETTLCPAECGLMETHQHYLSCYAPPLMTQKKKCLRRLHSVWKVTKTATPILRTLNYIINCIFHEKEPFPRQLPPTPTPFDTSLHKAWYEQKAIGWRQLFRGRMSSQWALTQGIYYADHPDLAEQNKYSATRWSRVVIQNLLESSLDLWAARNQALHGATMEE